MDALHELRDARQIPGEPFRRWFRSADLELVVWESPVGTITGFELYYEEGGDPKALTWFRGKGFSHSRIDDGEGRPARHKMTPILVPDGTFQEEAIARRFANASRQIESSLSSFVIAKIAQYPEP